MPTKIEDEIKELKVSIQEVSKVLAVKEIESKQLQEKLLAKHQSQYSCDKRDLLFSSKYLLKSHIVRVHEKNTNLSEELKNVVLSNIKDIKGNV